MPLPFAVLAGAIAMGPTVMNIGSKVTKFYGRTGNLGRSATFGIGYGGGTAVGYNLIPQWNRKRNSGSYINKNNLQTLDTTMPYARSYARYPRRRYSYRSRYSRPYQRRSYSGYRPYRRSYRRY